MSTTSPTSGSAATCWRVRSGWNPLWSSTRRRASFGSSKRVQLSSCRPSCRPDLYWFTLEPALPIDFEIGNWFTSTNPSSRFSRDFLAERLTPELRLSVFNAKVTERYSSGETRQRILSNAEEFAALLEHGLGVVPPVDPVEIWNRLAKG